MGYVEYHGTGHNHIDIYKAYGLAILHKRCQFAATVTRGTVIGENG